MADEILENIRSEDLPLFYKVGSSMMNMVKFNFQQKQGFDNIESVKNSEAGESLQAAIQSRFVAQNSILMARFEDELNSEEKKLTPLVRISSAMQFIKYKRDFYSELQEKNIESFDQLSETYY